MFHGCAVKVNLRYFKFQTYVPTRVLFETLDNFLAKQKFNNTQFASTVNGYKMLLNDGQCYLQKTARQSTKVSFINVMLAVM